MAIALAVALIAALALPAMLLRTSDSSLLAPTAPAASEARIVHAPSEPARTVAHRPHRAAPLSPPLAAPVTVRVHSALHHAHAAKHHHAAKAHGRAHHAHHAPKAPKPAKHHNKPKQKEHRR